ncbi:hypothetical protein GCM10023328_47190 [Modestobacter marinus]|nr:hypothetical protein GCM10011589_45390 [Modestobacter marinus]
MPMPTEYFAALAGVNASVLLAAAVEWRAAVDAQTDQAEQKESRSAARLTVAFAISSCALALAVLGRENRVGGIGWALMAPTLGALATLYLLFFPADGRRINGFLAARGKVFWWCFWGGLALFAGGFFYIGLGLDFI